METQTRRLGQARKMLLFGLIDRLDYDIAQRLIEPTPDDLKVSVLWYKISIFVTSQTLFKM